MKICVFLLSGSVWSLTTEKQKGRKMKLWVSDNHIQQKRSDVFRNMPDLYMQIVCGYGFTAEDDFLYRIDRDTGRILEQIPLASQAYFILQKDDRLFVRTYDTNYVFQITR